MKKFSLALLLSSIVFFVHAQQNNAGDTTDYNKEILHVQIEPKFPGGNIVLKRYLKQRSLDIGTDSTDNETAIVSFLVDKEGKVSEVVVKNESSIDATLAERAKRAIIKGPKWMAAVHNGRNVIARNIILVTWQR